MKIYIAALYARRFELREVDAALRDAGHEPTSRWVWNAEESKGQREAAEMDLEDVRRADAVLFFGQPPRSMNAGGGRWFEIGYAYALGKPIMAVVPGGTETIFLHLEEMLRFERLEDALQALGAPRPPAQQQITEGLNFQYKEDPNKVQSNVLDKHHGAFLFQLTDMERDVVREAREAGRATLNWDLETVTGRLGALMGVEGLQRVRRVEA